MVNILFGIIGLLVSQSLLANPINLDQLKSGELQGKNIRVFVDESKELHFTDILQIPEQKFALQTSDAPSFGFKPFIYWAKFQLSNPNEQAQKVLLRYGYAMADHVTLFYPAENNTYSSLSLGDRTPFSNQNTFARVPVFPIDAQPGLTTYYLKLETLGSHILPISLWKEADFAISQGLENLFLAALLGIILAMTGYNLFLFISFKTRVYAFYVIYMAIFFTHLLGAHGISRTFLFTNDAHHWFSNEGFLITTELVGIFMVLFTEEFLNLKEKMPRLFKFFFYYRFFQIANLFLIQFISYEVGAKTASLSILIVMISLIYAGLSSALRGYRPAYFYTLAFISVLLGNVVVSLKYQGLVPFNGFTEWFQLVAGASEALLLSLALGDRVNYYRARAEREIHQLNSDLKRHIDNIESIVDEKTRDIRSTLDNIPQGVFRIIGDCEVLKIDQEYSESLEKIVEMSKLGGKDPFQMIFARSDLGPAELANLETVLKNCLGEDEIQWSGNLHILPTEFHFDEKIIELDWAPILSSDDTIEKILCVLKDVTQERELQEQLLREAQSAITLQEVAKVHSFQKVDRFLKSAKFYLESCRQNIEDLLFCYRQIHTLKGVALIYGFKKISDQAHCLEELIAKRSTVSQETIATSLKTGLDELEAILQGYLETTLSIYGDAENTIPVHKDILEDLEFWITNGHSERALRQLLILHEYNLNRALSDELEACTALALRLGKEAPRFVFEHDDYLLDSHLIDIIRRAFIHVLRNSVDHGLETAKERLKTGKPPAGEIRFAISVNADKYRILYSDDGRGLDLIRIRQQLAKEGIEEDLSPEILVEQIFRSGLSTASAVTDISGRGVGMDAVKRFIENEGGSVRLLCKPSPIPERMLFRLEITLPFHGRKLELAS